MAAKKKTTAKVAVKKAEFKPITAETVKQLLKLKASGKLGRASLVLDSLDDEVTLEVPTGEKDSSGDKAMHAVFSMRIADFAAEAAKLLGLKVEIDNA